MTKIIIQGYEGSFHDEVSQKYFDEQDLEIVSAESFQVLGHRFQNELDIDFAVMAIENNIAGSILQNYRIIRERGFCIIGETYLNIKMNLMVRPGVTIDELTEIYSHPMALYQCTKYLGQYTDIKLIEYDDTALSAELVARSKSLHIGAIASSRAAEIYDLEVIATGIEDEKKNYTRFFILSRDKMEIPNASKGSIWCRIGHEKGSLLNLLKIIYDHEINLSKLQSYPIAGVVSEYSFHMDVEFDSMEQYIKLKKELLVRTKQFLELGIYQKEER